MTLGPRAHSPLLATVDNCIYMVHAQCTQTWMNIHRKDNDRKRLFLLCNQKEKWSDSKRDKLISWSQVYCLLHTVSRSVQEGDLRIQLQYRRQQPSPVKPPKTISAFPSAPLQGSITAKDWGWDDSENAGCNAWVWLCMAGYI